MLMIDLIRKCTLFYELYDDEFEQFIEDCKVEYYESGDEIVTMGEPGEDFFVILEGNVNVLIPKNDQSINLVTLQSGDFFGELVLIDDLVRNATVVAKEKCTCLVISSKIFYDLYTTNTKVFSVLLMNISRVLIKRLKISNERIVKLCCKE